MDQSTQYGSIEDVDMQLDEVIRPCPLDGVLDMNDNSTWRRGCTDIQLNVYNISAIANDSDSYKTGSEMLIDFNGLSLDAGNERVLATIAFGKSGICTTASAFMQDLTNVFGPVTIGSDGRLLVSIPTTSNHITALEDAEVELLRCQPLKKVSNPYVPFDSDHISD